MGTPSQRGFLAVVAGIIAIGLLFSAWHNRVYVPLVLPAQGPLADRLVDRLDPNTAPWEELALLPGLGESHSKQIVRFREDYIREFHKARAFNKPQDLLMVKGIGAAMLEKLRPHLLFPATSPSQTHEPGKD